jgi:hypothetical protein
MKCALSEAMCNDGYLWKFDSFNNVPSVYKYSYIHISNPEEKYAFTSTGNL